MTPFVLFGSMALLLAIGVPISFALGGAVMAAIIFSPDFYSICWHYSTKDFWWFGVNFYYGYCLFRISWKYNDKGWYF